MRRTAGVRVAAILALFVGLMASGVARAFDHSHSAFDQVLRTYVSDGRVAYGKLAADRAGLDGYLASLAAVEPAELEGFTREQAMAFWINAYNAATLRLIIDHRPAVGIRDIDGAWDRITFDLAGEKLTLNHVEHEILRKRYPDPRLHMVLVCAAKSCPKLASHAFTADTLEQRLDEAARAFARDTTRNRYEGGVLYVSRIFEWYGGDFVPRFAPDGDDKDAIRGFFAHYLDEPALAGSDTEIRYLDYDWSLNGTF